ncbi:SRPBCC domain-containing protein [Isoptericola sp. NPDC057391]|uniref:SRPBCC domain-containing protein n=1 Tax=Isoptericola sp. NPDC057391 TaxID=3346117 RepID=UPI00362994BB
MTTPTRPPTRPPARPEPRPETDAATVSVAVDVAAPVEHVFDVFTLRMTDWWEPTHHLLDDTSEMLVEPWVGGALTDVNPAGERCTWGRVLVFDRPAAFAFSWNITARWELETDPARCSEVHLVFTALDARRTRVVLEHRHLDRHGAGWEGMRDAVGGTGGWGLDLRRLAEVAAASA